MSSTKSNRNKELELQLALAEKLWGPFTESISASLRLLISRHQLSISCGDLLYLNQHWYVTHSGLLNIAKRRRCSGIRVLPALEFCDVANTRYAFQATVHKYRGRKGFTGYGDADPSNVSPLVHGAEMRVAETRAVNRALRKAYGIGICSVEEIGSFSAPTQGERQVRKLPPESVNGNSSNRHESSGNGIRVRDRLCQLIRQHQLDANLVKAYAVDFCGAKTLREATREQVENFVAHLADWADKDRNALLCQLNSYLRAETGAA
jgi:hypothetical protein